MKSCLYSATSASVGFLVVVGTAADAGGAAVESWPAARLTKEQHIDAQNKRREGEQ